MFLRVDESTSRKEFSKRISGPEFSGWWLVDEGDVGEVKVIRLSDKKMGTLNYKNGPRFYFNWLPDR